MAKQVAVAEQQSKATGIPLHQILDKNTKYANYNQVMTQESQVGYIQCPTCGRSFNQKAGARHIPQCQSIINKPRRLVRGSGVPSYSLNGSDNSPVQSVACGVPRRQQQLPHQAALNGVTSSAANNKYGRESFLCNQMHSSSQVATRNEYGSSSYGHIQPSPRIGNNSRSNISNQARQSSYGGDNSYSENSSSLMISKARPSSSHRTRPVAAEHEVSGGGGMRRGSRDFSYPTAATLGITTGGSMGGNLSSRAGMSNAASSQASAGGGYYADPNQRVGVNRNRRLY